MTSAHQMKALFTAVRTIIMVLLRGGMIETVTADALMDSLSLNKKRSNKKKGTLC